VKKTFDFVSRLAGVLALVLILAFGLWLFMGPTEAPVARSYSVPVHIEQGGEKLVIESGGELEAQSGAVVDLQGGSTITMPNATFTGTVSAEQLTSTDDATIADALTAASATINGNTVVTGTLDAQGDVSDSGGDFTVADNAVITGTADLQGTITLENDETIANSTDGVVTIGGFLGLTEGAVVEATAGGTLTPVGSFQPITSSAVITNAVIADGSAAGQIVVIVNENAADDITILESGSNLDAGGDITLTGGAVDAAMLMWTGSTWTRLSFEDN
jgi:hypothetical protein